MLYNSSFTLYSTDSLEKKRNPVSQHTKKAKENSNLELGKGEIHVRSHLYKAEEEIGYIQKHKSQLATPLVLK